MLLYSTFPTSLGVCALAFGDRGVAGFALPSQTEAATVRALLKLVRARRLDGADPTIEANPPAWVRDLMARVTALLDGSSVDLSDVPLDTRKLSDFRERIYAAARNVPCGSRATYGELAKAAGNPRAARAVGRAMATNPFPVLVPCHRVVSSQGELHGFSAPGGVRTKATMLALEASARAEPEPTPAPAGRTRATRSRSSTPKTSLPLFR